MDISDTWLEHILRDLLPPPYIAALEQHILHPHSPFQLLKRRAFSLANRTLNIIYPFLMPLATRLTAFAHSSPDVVFFAAVLSLLYFAFVLVAWLRRVMLFWMRMAFRLVGLAVFGVLVAVAYQRGLEQTVQDLFAVVTRLAAYGVIVRDVWLSEYEKYQERERVQSASGRRRP